MNRPLYASAIVLLTIGLAACGDEPTPAAPAPPAPPKAGWEFTPEDFSIGHKHTPNAWCNSQIDKLLEETRTCFNSRPAPECETLQKANSKKIGQFIRARRCTRK